MRQAFTHLRTGRSGPVLVAMPRGLGEYDPDVRPYRPVCGWRSSPTPEDIAAAVQALRSAKRPLLYAGEGIFYADAVGELVQFAELAQIPVLTTLKGKSAFPEDHPLSVGVRGEAAIHFLQTSDLILAIGTSLSLGHFRHTIPEAHQKTIIHCTVDPADLNRTYRTDIALLGDAKLCLQALIREAMAQGGIPRREGVTYEIADVKEAMFARYRPLMASEERPINPYRVYGDLLKTLDRRASLVSPDSGNPRDQTSTVFEALIPRGYVGWGNVSTLGFS
ncbi:MAG: hypothetical protein H5T70_08565, partial [Chloroflexi bacterium]|nr:hypothetical protein [Chloroflexota bacterium]